MKTISTAGCILGIVAVTLAAIKPISDKTLTFWGIACAISLVIFLILFIPIVIGIEYCIKCTRSPEDLEQKSAPKEVKKQESTGHEYFDVISRKHGGTPIRSISQYRKPKPGQAPVRPSPPPPKAQPARAPAPVKKEDSTGSEYFNQINRAGVKSISQYAGLKKK